jgi:hypothetical protein
LKPAPAWAENTETAGNARDLPQRLTDQCSENVPARPYT